MQMRSAAALAAAVALATPAAASPATFDFFSFSLAAGAGGVVDQFPIGPEIDFESIEELGSGSLAVSESSGGRLADATIAYDISVDSSSASSVFMSAEFTSTINLQFAPADMNGSLEAFTSLDSVTVEFTLLEDSFFEVSGLGGDMFDLDSSSDLGAIAPGEIVLLAAGSYAFDRFDSTDISERAATPGVDEGTFIDSVSFGLSIVAVPAPSSAAVLGLAGLAAARRRRRRA